MTVGELRSRRPLRMVVQRGRNGGNDVPSVTLRAYLHAEEMEVYECTRRIGQSLKTAVVVSRRPSREAPRGARAAIAAAAQLKHTTHSEYVRQALLRCLEADGVTLRRGMVKVTGEAA